MKADDFFDVIRNIPTAPRAYFIVKKVPAWAKGTIEVGQWVVWDEMGGTFSQLDGSRIRLGVSHVDFKEYS